MTGKRKRKHKDAPPASVAVASLLGAKKVEKKKGRKVKKARKAGTAKCGKENAQVEDKDKNIDDCANKAKKRKHALDGMDAEQKRVKLGDAEGAGQIQRETLSRQVKGKAECLDSQAQAAAQTRGKDSSQAFVPSKSFQGARPGYVFKKGAKGLGYYLDNIPAKAATAAKASQAASPLGTQTKAAADKKVKDQSQAFLPAKSFQGARPGYVFKKGAQGIGYYVDGQAKAVADKKGKDQSPAFMPAKSFQGARPGYAFKKGAQGLGYYLDMQAKAAGHRKGKDEKGKDESKGFIPAKSFQGVRPGFAFKKGAKGLGYYLDMQPHVQDKKLRLR